MHSCPQCNELQLVVKIGQEAVCGVCGTTFDAPDNLPVPCSCDETRICDECMAPKLQEYKASQDELTIPQEFVELYHKDKYMEDVQIWRDIDLILAAPIPP